MFQIHSWPECIAHVDGDAFFASVVQAMNPSLKGKPLVTGRERGIATAISYEAKKYGITRGMRFSEMKKCCPSCLFIDSDYESYALFSKRMFEIMRKYSPVVEEYSIDEGFLDLKGMRRPLGMTYEEIGKHIQEEIEKNLGISVSVGISITKSLAKIASNFRKPRGLVLISGKNIEYYLRTIPTKGVWGIGEQTSSYLTKLGIKTAYEFISQKESYIMAHLSKPYWEIWKELRGEHVYKLNPDAKETYKSISRTQTYTPPTTDKEILWARLLHHIEEAFQKARTHHYQVGKLIIFLKTQTFHHHVSELTFAEKVSYPMLIRNDIRKGFESIYRPRTPYRTTGCTITDFETDSTKQQSLFGDSVKEDKMKKIYPFLEKNKVDFGTSLFDKENLMPRKTKQKPSLPFLSLEDLC